MPTGSPRDAGSDEASHSGPMGGWLEPLNAGITPTCSVSRRSRRVIFFFHFCISSVWAKVSVHMCLLNSDELEETASNTRRSFGFSEHIPEL